MPRPEETAAALSHAFGKTCVDVDELLALSQQVPRILHHLRLLGAGQSAGDNAIELDGQGMSYIDSRPFTAGDDVRRMDWRVMARTNELHTKVFDSERNQTWWLVVDARPSMAFGTRRRFKLVQAARIASLLAATGQAIRHSVGLIVLNDTSAMTLSAGQSREQLANIAKLLSKASVNALSPSSAERSMTLQGIEQAALGIRRGAVVFLVSDFLGWSDSFYTTVHQLHVSSHIRAVRIADRLQTQPLPIGHYPIHDGERRMQLVIKEQADAVSFLKQMRTQIETVDQRLKNLAIPISTVEASVEIDQMITLLAKTLLSCT